MLLQHVRELIADSREHLNLKRQLRKIIRLRPQMSEAYHLMVRIEWDRQRRDRAVELFWFAACLDDKDERHAQSFFVSMRCVGRAIEALETLQSRFDRLGRLSSRPALTLCWALEEIGQVHRAIDICWTVIEWRPDDGEFLLYAADFIARRGNVEKAKHLLQEAENHSKQTAWRRQAAALALYGADSATALKQYDAIVSQDPLAIDCQRTYVRLLAETKGIPQALDYLRRDRSFSVPLFAESDVDGMAART